jgi:hypothetical protein
MSEILHYIWPGNIKVEITFDRSSKEFILFDSCFKLQIDNKMASIIDDEGLLVCTGFFDGDFWQFEWMKQVIKNKDPLIAAIKITCIAVQSYQKLFILMVPQIRNN